MPVFRHPHCKVQNLLWIIPALPCHLYDVFAQLGQAGPVSLQPSLIPKEDPIVIKARSLLLTPAVQVVADLQGLSTPSLALLLKEKTIWATCPQP